MPSCSETPAKWSRYILPATDDKLNFALTTNCVILVIFEELTFKKIL